MARARRKAANVCYGVITCAVVTCAVNASLADLAVAAVLFYGGQAVLDDAVTLGTIVLFTRYIDMLFQPIVALGDQYNLLFRAMASGERIFQALDWHEPLHRPEDSHARSSKVPARKAD